MVPSALFIVPLGQRGPCLDLFQTYIFLACIQCKACKNEIIHTYNKTAGDTGSVYMAQFSILAVKRGSICIFVSLT